MLSLKDQKKYVKKQVFLHPPRPLEPLQVPFFFIFFFLFFLFLLIFDENEEGMEYCNICYEENELVSLPCSHAFCKGFFYYFFFFFGNEEIHSSPLPSSFPCLQDCWDRYLSIEVKERKQILLCCGKDCSMVMDEFTVLSLLVRFLFSSFSFLSLPLSLSPSPLSLSSLLFLASSLPLALLFLFC